jgi:acyl-CoA synthetase (AMP-forming)/AMP-acid ligase II
MFADDLSRSYTGVQALDHALRFSSALRNASLEPGDVVAFFCMGSAPHVLAWFGAVTGGYVASNLHTRNDSEAQVATALQWLGAKAIVYDEAFASLVEGAVRQSGAPIRMIALDGEEGGWATFIDSAPALDYDRERPSAASLAAISLSSGSTGQPKGVMHTQASLLACALAGQAMLEGMNRHDTLLFSMNPSYAGWLVFVLSAVAGKSRTYLMRRYEPVRLLDLIERERATIVPLVPTMWRMLLEHDLAHRDLSSLRLACVGGEAPTADDVTRINAHICKRIGATYIAGESMNGCTVMAVAEDLLAASKIGSTGQPTAGADVRIVDPYGSIHDQLPVGETGEIVVTGSSLAIGYWRDPALTAKKFVEGWWRSGDLGRLDEDGFLWVDGRADNVINTGGIKVHAEEIEAAILTHESITACAVVGRADAKFGQRIEAYVVAADSGLTAESLDAYLRNVSGLSGYKVPKRIHFLDALPTGLTGKLDRRALRDRKDST